MRRAIRMRSHETLTMTLRYAHLTSTQLHHAARPLDAGGPSGGNRPTHTRPPQLMTGVVGQLADWRTRMRGGLLLVIASFWLSAGVTASARSPLLVKAGSLSPLLAEA